MSWILFALGNPFFSSMMNHIDKYLLRRFFSDTGAHILIIFSSLIGLFVAPIIFIVHWQTILLPIQEIIPLVSSGTLFVLASFLYFKALEKDDASMVVPLFQMIPVFVVFLSFFILGETLSTRELFWSIIITLGAFGISLDLNQSTFIVKWSMLGFMFLSSILYSLDTVLFKAGATEVSIWVSTGWQYVGFFLPGIFVLLFFPTWRKEFVSLFKEKSVPILSLNVLNEIINLFAKVCVNFASLLVPLTLVWVMNGFQPFFVFLFGILLTIFFPKISQEDIGYKTIIQKIICITIMVVGVYFLQR